MTLHVICMGEKFDAFHAWMDPRSPEYLFHDWEDFCETQARLIRGISILFIGTQHDGTEVVLQALPGAIRDALFNNPFPRIH